MAIRKEITKDNELYLWMNGNLIYKRWINLGYSKVFDLTAYGKDTFVSITDDGKSKRKFFLNGYVYETQEDFWNAYTKQLNSESRKDFGKNLDAFNDAITAGGPGYPGECIIEIIGVENLKKIFGETKFQFILDLLTKAEFVELIIEKNYG